MYTNWKGGSEMPVPLAPPRAIMISRSDELLPNGLYEAYSNISVYSCPFVVNPLGSRGEASSLPNSLHRFSGSLPLRFSM